MKSKWLVRVSENSGKSQGWVTFHAEKVVKKSETILLVDGYKMEFNEKILTVKNTGVRVIREDY